MALAETGKTYWKGNRKSISLRISILLVLTAVFSSAFYVALFVPEKADFYPFHINSLRSGEWKQFMPMEGFISGPKLLKTSIVKDSLTGEKIIRLRALNSSTAYSGLIFHIKKPVPANAELSIRWRSTGFTPMVLIDVMDGSKPVGITSDLGENFDVEYPAPKSRWSVAEFPLDTLELNTYQVAGKKLDGVFDFNQIRRVSFTFFPKTDITLDISDIHFQWDTKKWSVFSVLIFLGFMGIVILLRTTSSRLFVPGGSSLRVNAFTARAVYIMMSLAVMASAFLAGPDFFFIPTLSFYAVIIILIMIEEFTQLFQMSKLWSVRYFVVTVCGIYFGFSGGMISLCLLVLASYIPVILEKSRTIFWIAVTVVFSTYILKQPVDNHFSFLAGFIMILGVSIAAVMVREFLQHQKASFLTENAIFQYESLFKKTSDAIYILDISGRIVTSNQGFERLTGYSQNDLKGCMISDFICEESKDTLSEMLRCIEENDLGQFDIHFKHKSGEVRTALVRGSAIYKDKQIVGYQALATDITERKLSEEQLIKSAEQLKQDQDLLEKRAAELAELNRQLKLSEERLKELNTDKDKFFSIISHDLKSPFNSLLGFSDLLLNDYEELSDEEIKTFTLNINTAAKNLYKFIDNLLQWATIQSGKMEYNPSIIKLHDVVESTIGILSGNAVKKDIRLFNKVAKNTFVYADFNSVNSIVQNLIVNAVKFTNPGGEVSVSAELLGKDVEITVADTGVGMSQQEMDKLFRIDVQHSTKGTAKESGTGLGLILCKEMIEKNGGTIRIESQKALGSRFIFTLPRFVPVSKETVADTLS